MTAFHGFSTIVPRLINAAILFFLPFVAVAIHGPLAADKQAVSSAHSAYWYNPERNGEGLVLEVLSDELALVYWFTFDESGNQRWLLDVGNIDGNQIIFPELMVTAGGRFGSDFDLEQVERTIVGEAVLSFSDCNSAEWRYSAYGEAETISVTRLTQTMAAGCQPINGVPGQPAMEYAGQSGSWFDPARSGEGFTLQWMSRNEAVVVWFTYDTEGNQHWVIGVGSREGDEIVFPMTHSASGPRFGSSYDKEKLELSEWGKLTFNMDCDNGVVQYDSPLPNFGEGVLNLSRLTKLSKPDCPYQKPKLSDLYEFQITEIDFRPLADDSGSVLKGMNFEATDIASDGTVVGERGWMLKSDDLFRWSPLNNEIFLTESEGSVTGNVFVTADSSRAITTLRVTNPEDESVTYWGPIWGSSETGHWEPIPNFHLETSAVYGVSRSGNYLVGKANPTGEKHVPWIWSAEQGLTVFELSSDLRVGVPWSVSDDGSAFVGNQADFSKGFREEFATRWTRDGGPELLRDEEGQVLGFGLTCNASCNVVPGSFHGGELDYEDPNSQKFWLWTKDSGVQYFDDDLPGIIDSFYPPSRLVFDTTSDGSLFVGRYLTIVKGVFTEQRVERPVIWTQSTGVSSLVDLLDGVEGWDSNWKDVQAVAVSNDGRKVLLNGDYHIPPEPALGKYSRAIVVELVPK